MKNKISGFFKTIFNTLSRCIVPILPVLIGAGMVKVLLLVLGPTVLNIISETNSTYVVLSFVSDAGFYFLPIFVAVSAADVFETDKFMAALVGAILISPTFIDLVNSGYDLSIFKIPIASASYANQIIPSILCVLIMSYIYNFLNNHIHKNVSGILTPLITLLIMVPVELCMIAPLGVWVSNYLVKFILFVKDLGPIGIAIFCALAPYTVIFGVSGASITAITTLMAIGGSDPICYFSNILFNSILGFVTLALYVRNKEADCLAASITATIGGVGEPGMFGYMVKDIKSLISLTIACFVGGFMAGIFGVETYAFASFGIFGAVATINETTSIVPSLICLAIGCATGFILNFIVHSTKKKS